MAKKKRKVQKRNSFNNVKKRFVKLFVVVGIVSTVSVGVVGVWTARNILKPISIFASETTRSEVNKNENQFLYFTVEIDEDKIIKQAQLNYLDNEEHTLKEIVITGETQMHLPYGLKEFKLQSLYKIAELEKPDNPIPLIKQTLIEYFGVGTSNMYIFKSNDSTFNQALQSPTTMIRLAFDDNWAKSHITTNESRFDLVKISQALMSIPSQHKSTVDIEEYGIGEKTTDIDGTQIIKTDINKLDTYVKKSFQNDEVREEKANIIVENGTEITGLGKRVSRIVSNMGGLVIELGNTEQTQEQTTISVKDENWQNSETVQELLKCIPESQVIVNSEISSKSDIVVTVGNGYAKVITGEIN